MMPGFLQVLLFSCIAGAFIFLILAIIALMSGPPMFPVAAGRKWQALAIVTNPFNNGRPFNCGSWDTESDAVKAAKQGARYLDRVVPKWYKEPIYPSGFTWTQTELGIDWAIMPSSEIPAIYDYLYNMSEAIQIYKLESETIGGGPNHDGGWP